MSSFEIEDVLSSIRRLVSEDLRPTHKLVSAALQNGASKLILTPALRIVSEVRTALPERNDTGEETPDLQTVLLDIDADDAASTADILPIFGSVRLLDQSERTTDFWQDEADTPASEANFLTTAMSRINVLAHVDDAIAGQSQSDTIEAVVAAVGAAVGPDEWEVDGGDPAPQSKSWSDAAWNSDADVDVPDLDVPDLDEPGQTTLAADVVVQDPSGFFETTAHNKQAETTLAQESPENRDDFVGQDSIVFHDNPSFAEENAENSASADDDDLVETTGFLNEDLLREIVRDMIREELQGSLGERITRNVRKLVRTEINRALASRDFDEVASR